MLRKGTRDALDPSGFIMLPCSASEVSMTAKFIESP